jgi:hypothetical protein
VVLNGFQSKAKTVGPVNATEEESADKTKKPKVNPGSPRENFFSKMFSKIGEKVSETFKDED